MLDLSFAYMPPTLEPATSLAPGPPPFGLEWRRQHLGKGRLLLAATPGVDGQVPATREGAVAFAAWDDDEPWGPWTGNGTFWLPAVQPFQEGTYLATVHLPYLQGQVALQLTVHSEWGPAVSRVKGGHREDRGDDGRDDRAEDVGGELEGQWKELGVPKNLRDFVVGIPVKHQWETVGSPSLEIAPPVLGTPEDKPRGTDSLMLPCCFPQSPPKCH